MPAAVRRLRLRQVLKLVLVGGAVGVTFVDCVGYVAKVEGPSMQPALNPECETAPSGKRFHSDYVFLNRWAVRNCNVSRGDVVSLRSPKDPEVKIIKRVIALEGDLIETAGWKEPITEIPSGHCWIEGDHRGRSLDSNLFGPVSIGLILTKATHIVWPPHRWGRIDGQIPLNRMTVSLGLGRMALVHRLEYGEPSSEFGGIGCC
ncbi:unnamed protein product [Cyprideis torosa]|uniref:Mitochondrial inner membrane protease subunit 2 n=1 Tax=Cyprideis torosa TaxID=163714 RepID=A0A7R8WBW3_9CRUS|nr:unnamed protein product [Cyprideis torosa]CAG0892536.1 unnamed protein product [Cyprideis torosa]